MKTLSQILVLAVLILGSCTSRLYTGSEYDDLYFQPSDKPVEKVRPSADQQITGGNARSSDYYDNIYAADTLVSDAYSNAVDYNDSITGNNNYNNNGGGYDYYNDYSYAGNLRRFYGNYFDPYWRDPFYFDFGYPYSFDFGFGFGGFPYYGYNDPYLWNHYYGYNGLYGDYYGGMYGGYYGGMYGGYYGGLYGGYYGGLYGGYGYPGGYYYSEGKYSVPYGRRERPSTMSSKWNTNMGAGGFSGGTYSGSGRRTDNGSTAVAGSNQRRTLSDKSSPQQPVNQVSRKSGTGQSVNPNTRSNSSVQRNSATSRPEYNSVNRTYTPSYTNPRMSTRPAYNNSRASETINPGYSRSRSSVINNSRTNSGSNPVRNQYNQGGVYQNPNNNSRNSNNSTFQRRNDSYNAPANTRSNTFRGTNSYSVPASRYSVPSRSSEFYSVPSRSGMDRTRENYSSGSSYYGGGSSEGRSSSFSGSSGSESRSSSFSSGSESRGSSFSSGSSSGSSGGGASSSSGGRRR